LSMSDGSADLIAISKHSRIPFESVVRAAKALEAVGLLREATSPVDSLQEVIE
jgi:hypothetical protein